MSLHKCNGVFSPDEWLRYTRHIQLSKFGSVGQSKLKNSHVVMVGAGGLGCPVGLYIAAAGVGRITIIDGDTIELTNLQRQVAFETVQIGEEKATCLAARMSAINDQISVVPIVSHLTPDNADSFLADADIVLDCTDNFATRYLINDTCYKYELPWVMASIGQYNGQISLFNSATCCFRCVFPETPTGVADCNSSGVLGVLPGQLGLLQATEALKYLVGLDTPLQGNLLLVDALSVSQQRFKLQKSEACVLCGEHELSEEAADGHQVTLSDFYQTERCAIDTNPINISPERFDIMRSECRVIDVRSDEERASFNIGGEHIPLSSILESDLDYGEEKPVIFYCQSGGRSLKAAEHAQQHMQKNVYSLESGLAGWLKVQLVKLETE